ncbi:MAG TPA: dihydroorotase [Candidatus Hydrogenedentes bacterium]|nr:dihydroorotase [Candidatus Hydrogenedentota bacterium]
MALALINGHLIDPASGISEPMDLVIADGKIREIGRGLRADETLDLEGLVVCPGLVDIQVHFREPGFESKETIASGSRAAAAGGVTSVVMMPNTNPPIDNSGILELVTRRIAATACVRVYSTACATKGRKGEEITEMADLKAAGAVAVTDDGNDIASSAVMRRVLEYAAMVGLPYFAHCQDEALSEGGAMNEGYTATRLGIPGISREAEDIRVDRNIRLAMLAGAHIHIQHISTAGAIEIVRQAKKRGARVTAETAPHYFSLTDEAADQFNTNAKMYPPLRGPEDIETIIAGIQDGTIDNIATDHAPHTATEKNVEFQYAPFGIIGLETMLAVTMTYLVKPGHVTLEKAIELMTTGPARVCGLPAGTIAPETPADLCVFDPNATWTVTRNDLASKSHNTPYLGKTLQGRVRYTFCGGNLVYQCP